MQQVRARRDSKTGCEFARGGSAAEAAVRFEHEHRAAAAGKIVCANQAVVSAADHDAVEFCARRCARDAHCALPKSRSTARAAFAPGAPMTPPPGCVLDPHI